MIADGPVLSTTVWERGKGNFRWWAADGMLDSFGWSGQRGRGVVRQRGGEAARVEEKSQFTWQRCN